MAKSNYIACLTSYPERFGNLPRVIESLWAQTCKPQHVVLTLARNEYAEYMRIYPDGLKCDVLVIEKDVKVYKKFLYAMDRYATDPFDLFLCVDDDYIYSPETADMLLQGYEIEDKPVSGNSYWHNGLKCHCGALSLVFPAMFQGWESCVGHFERLKSSDMFYTMLAANNHYTYTSAGDLLSEYAKKIPSKHAYTVHGQVQSTYEKFGRVLGWF